uniref:F-box domain-containing protein n=1 Tax=Aspergillus flavipes TaxID=41900 RepID=A0A7L8UX33_ASPFV|nr:hypothetical protein [Aspergillus flavipes]
MAATLPIEIVQTVLSYLDVESYHAARQSCYLWRCAASSPSMLRDALQQVPVSLPSTTGSLSRDEWNLYFGQVAHLNLLGYRRSVEKTVSQRSLPDECSPTAVVASTPDGRTTVALKGTQVVVYEQNQPQVEFPLASTLYPHWTAVCRALMESRNGSCMSVNQRYAKHRIALSSTCNFVAIGLGRVIQVYGLREDDKRSVPAEYVLGQGDVEFTSHPGTEYEDTDGVVDGLEFADNDRLLRVAIGKETTIHRPTRVRYLGQPEEHHEDHPEEPPSFEYWKKHLHNIYTDSAALAVTLTGADDYRSTFRGLRLLPRSYHPCSQHIQGPPTPPPDKHDSGSDRFFVASLQTGHTDSYCIGQITSPGQTVRVHRLFPSIYFRPGNTIPGTRTEGPPRLYPPVPSSEREQAHMTYRLPEVVTRWNAINLPSATFSSPLLAVSDDHRLLVVYEPGAGHSCCIVDGGSLYVYCMEDCEAAYQPPKPMSPVASGVPGSEGEVDSATIYDRLQMVAANPLNDSRYDPPDIIPSWPFLLDRTSMDVDALRVERCEGKGMYIVTGEAGTEVIQWEIGERG